MDFRVELEGRKVGAQFDCAVKRLSDLRAAVAAAPTDARNAGLYHVQQVLVSMAGLSLGILHFSERGSDHELIRQLWITPLPKDRVKTTLDDLSQYQRASLVTLMQFAFENLIMSILSEAGVKPKSDGFSESVRSVLHLAGLDDLDHLHKQLNVLALMRNSLHRNGMHCRKSATVVLGETKYTFEKDKPVLCSTWSHILYATWFVTGIYEKVLFSEPIRGLSYIPGNYYPHGSGDIRILESPPECT